MTKLKEPATLNFDSDVAYFIGVLQGDGGIIKSVNEKGWLMTYAIRITVSTKDKSYVDVLENIIKNKLNYAPHIRLEEHCYRVAIYDRGLVRALEEYKTNMKIPDFVLNNNELLSAYLQGLFDTDGCCYISNNRSGVIDFSNNKKNLVDEVQKILDVKFNIKSGIRVNRKGNYKPVYRLIISNKSNIEPFITNIGFRHPRKNTLSKKLLKFYKNMRLRSVRNLGHAKIVDTLRRSGEMTTNEIAYELKLHRETVKEHLEKLEKKNLVTKRSFYFNRWGQVKKSKFMRYYWRLEDGKKQL